MEILPPVVAVLKLIAGCAVGRSCSQLPAVLFPICHWGSHCSIGPSSHERRESKCFFQSCHGVLEGLSYDPASHSHSGVAEEPSPVPMPRTRHRAALSHVALPPSSSQPPCKDSSCLQTYNPTNFTSFQHPPALSGCGCCPESRAVRAAFTQSLCPASLAPLSWSAASVNLGVLLNYAIM